MANKSNIPDRVYHEAFVLGSTISQKYKKSFSSIINKDYPNKKYGFSQRILDKLCIDMDSIEKDNTGKDNNTMDMVVGIAQFDDHRRAFNKDRFLPVELKLGCKSFDEISKTELLRKDQHTRDLLNSFSVSVDPFSIFLFTKKVAPSAKNIKSRWENETNGSKIKTWEMKSPEDYNTYIQFENDFPYKTLTDIDNLKDKINDLFSNGNIEELIDFIENWKSRAEDYKYKHNNNECSAIADALTESIQPLIGRTQDADIDEYLMILEGEISSLKSL